MGRLPLKPELLDEAIAAKRKELAALNDEIADRARYKTGQERLIADLIESGNTQLSGLNYDILLAKQELKGLKTDIRTARNDKRIIEEDLEVMRLEITTVMAATDAAGDSAVVVMQHQASIMPAL